MKFRILLFRAKFQWRNFLRTRQIKLMDDIISAWTWIANIGTGPFGHVEVWLPDEDGTFDQIESHFKGMGISAIAPNNYLGTCYTSTMRDGGKGTCKRSANEVIKHPERLDYVEINLPQDMYYAMKAWMEIEIDNNKGYSKRDILKFVGLGYFADPTRNICSEFVHNALVVAGVFKFPYKVVSPRRVAKLLMDKGYKVKKLTDS